MAKERARTHIKFEQVRQTEKRKANTTGAGVRISPIVSGEDRNSEDDDDTSAKRKQKKQKLDNALQDSSSPLDSGVGSGKEKRRDTLKQNQKNKKKKKKSKVAET